MEYHGKQYSVILTIRGKWKWSAEIEGQYRSGLAISRPAGVKLTERAIDKALWSLLSDRAFQRHICAVGAIGETAPCSSTPP
jgi:hypothetical protein